MPRLQLIPWHDLFLNFLSLNISLIFILYVYVCVSLCVCPCVWRCPVRPEGVGNSGAGVTGGLVVSCLVDLQTTLRSVVLCDSSSTLDS